MEAKSHADQNNAKHSMPLIANWQHRNATCGIVCNVAQRFLQARPLLKCIARIPAILRLAGHNAQGWQQ